MFKKNLVLLAFLFYEAVSKSSSQAYHYLHLHNIAEILRTESKKFEASLELKKDLYLYFNQCCLNKVNCSIKKTASSLFQNASLDYYLREVVIKDIKAGISRDSGDGSQVIALVKTDLAKFCIYTAFYPPSLETVNEEDWDILKVYFGLQSEKQRDLEVIAEEYDTFPEDLTRRVHNINYKIIKQFEKRDIVMPDYLQKELLPIDSFA